MRVPLVVCFVLSAVMTGFGQLKSTRALEPTVSESLVQGESNSLMFGFFNPANLSMRHSFSLSYATFGGKGMSVGMYTNSLFYRISDPLNVQVDVSLVHSPYNSFSRGAQDNLSGLYVTRAELNYRPSENMWFQIQYRQLPGMNWYMEPYSSPWLFGPTRGFQQEGH